MNKLQKESLEKDIDILYDLYSFRIKTVDQLARKHGYTKGSMYHKVCKLKNKGLIATNSIKGFSSRFKNNRGLQGKCYRITNTGISFLEKHGYELQYNAESLKVSDMRVPVMLYTIDLFDEISSHGWTFIDSRRLKFEYNLNRGLNFEGMLSSPTNKHYPFYMLLENTTNHYIRRVRMEIGRLKFNDLLFFTKSPDVFERLLYELLEEGEVFSYKSVRILPHGYGWRYLVNYDDFQVMFTYLEDNHNVYKVEKNKDKRYQVDFETIVEYNNQEYYLVNMLDNNLTNIHFIENYSKERYEEDGRKILLLQSKTLFNYAKLLSNVHHIEYLDINAMELINYPIA